MPNPYVNKVTVNNATIIDLTADTAIASDVAAGKYFHLATGERVVGTASGGNDFVVNLSFNDQTEMWEPDCTYAEAYAAYQAGKSVLFEATGYVACFGVWDDDASIFYYQVDAPFDEFSGSAYYDWGVDFAGYVWTSEGIEVDSAGRYYNLTLATATPSDVAQGRYYYGVDGIHVGTASGSTPSLQSKTATPTTSQQVITADSGYDGLSQVTVSAMPSGTAGTPTATKGSVSNHSVSVTPSVTNTTGYITGGTKSGTAVTVSASELVSGNKAIAENGTNIDVTDYATVSVNVSGGGGDTYRLDNIVPEQTVACTTFMQNNAYYGFPTYSSPIDDAEQYLVTFDGTEYVCEGYVPENNATGVGDIRVANTNAAQYLITPFFIEYQTALGIGLIVRGSGTHTVKVDKLTFIDDGETFTTKTITQNGTYSASSDNADGYSSVTVNVPSGSSMNVQTAQSTTRVASTSYTKTASLTCSKSGTYDVYWDCFRSSTSGTNGSQLYIGGSEYGNPNTTFANSIHVQTNHLTGVQISAEQEVAVYVRSRATNYYAYCGQLTIVQTA